MDVSKRVKVECFKCLMSYPQRSILQHLQLCSGRSHLILKERDVNSQLHSAFDGEAAVDDEQLNVDITNNKQLSGAAADIVNNEQFYGAFNYQFQGSVEDNYDQFNGAVDNNNNNGQFNNDIDEQFNNEPDDTDSDPDIDDSLEEKAVVSIAIFEDVSDANIYEFLNDEKNRNQMKDLLLFYQEGRPLATNSRLFLPVKY
jgi:hypothetical protein